MDVDTGMYPDHPCRAWLFHNVTNVGELRSQAVDGGLPWAVLDATRICSWFTLTVAANKAACAAANDSLRSRTLLSEIVLAFAPTRSIKNSFKWFGLQPDSTSVLVVTFNATDETDAEVSAAINGDAGDPTTLGDSADEAAIRKIYKVPDDVTDVEDVVVGAIAVRDL